MNDKNKITETNNLIIDSSYEENHIPSSRQEFNKLNKELQDELIDMIVNIISYKINNVIIKEREYILEEDKKFKRIIFRGLTSLFLIINYFCYEIQSFTRF
jgi:hypothetical protein